MKIEAKNIYEKMIDFHRFASVLLAFGVFFYLGMIIPQETTTVTMLVSAGGSMISLALSTLFFYESKKLRKRLEESEEGQDYLMKK
jgi:hypothetical protein